MADIQLIEIAHGRSGDKGDSVNIGIIARESKWYPVLVDVLTEDVVAAHFRDICRGTVTRYLMPNIEALNFVLTEALDGGGTVSLRTDAQGKTLASALLRMTVTVQGD